MINKNKIKSFPSSTGIYIFKNNNKVLYIGKSVSLKARVISHLENAKLDLKEDAIVKNSNDIEYILTDSEFKALLLESKLIQKYHPKYNRRWQDDKSYLYVKVTIKDEYPKIYTVRKENDTKSLYFGPFPSQNDINEILRTIRKIFPFCTQRKISKLPCFYSKIGLCDPCPNEIVSINDINKRSILKNKYKHNIREIINVLKGKVELVLKNSYKELERLSKKQKFEEALKLRNKIIYFENLINQKQFTSDILNSYNRSSHSIEDLIKLLGKYLKLENNLGRIECYDISSFSQKDSTASMVVFTNGYPDKNQYRRFKIKNLKLKSDLDMLEETLERRFRQDWERPDLIVIDGGTPQIRRIKNVLSILNIKIPVIGIAKHPDRIIFGTDQIFTLRPPIQSLGFNLIRAIRDESHRFAKKYHLLLRNIRSMI